MIAMILGYGSVEELVAYMCCRSLTASPALREVDLPCCKACTSVIGPRSMVNDPRPTINLLTRKAGEHRHDQGL